MEIFCQQTLLIDADDTLWENNIYFERVIEAVQSLLAPFGVAPGSFRERLDALECEHIPVHGYGTVNFCRSLLEAFTTFLPGADHAGLGKRVEALALGILSQPVEVIEDVPETLEYLAPRHSLYLVTKGNAKEQAGKIESSSLANKFRGIEILEEKNATTYCRLIQRHGWDPSKTWMVGNSPRSDINPAIRAGMNAVFIPHAHTWVLEHEEPVQHSRVLALEKFAHLRRHF